MVASPSPSTYLAFVNVAPGLEELLSGELLELGFTAGRPVPGGVEVRVSLAELQRICSRSRLAEGVRVRLKSFKARTFAELEQGLSRLPWRAYLSQEARVRIDVTCHKSRLWHSDAVRERVQGVLSVRAGVSTEGEETSSTDRPPERIFVRLQDDMVTVSIDASGERLHKRGYRKHVAEASLRETLAAAMVRSLIPKAEGRVVLWDPFCGAGTIPLEALARAEAIFPERSFAFQSWPSVSGRAVPPDEQELSRSHKHEIRVIGSDHDARVIDAARANLEAMGLDGRARSHAEFLVGDLLSVASQVPAGAIVLTNPPYGERLEEGRATERLVRLVRERPDLRPVGALVGGTAKKTLPAEFRVAFQTKNGGLNVALRVLSAGGR